MGTAHPAPGSDDQEYAAADAKAHFSALLDRAAAGEVLTITRHGKPVAQLAPMPESEEAAIRRREKAWEEWEAYRRENKITLGPDLTIRQLIQEGRKY